ncbi:MAG: hypothetical protein AVO33_09590 [delta proteobacterium ML8_F1]|nr:MAG: hypothetical protein AVO33_09590 [delta proteobacterium ML8_F1]
METKELLMTLVRMDTSTREGANQAIDFAADYLKSRGIPGTSLVKGGVKSYVAVLGEGPRTLVYNGHLDVVSGHPSQFEPFIEGDRLVGRGTADMKAGCAAMINAVVSLKDAPLENRVMLQLVSDEEVGGSQGSKFLVDSGYLGDFVICTEPTNFNIALQAKGILRLDITSHGVAAHGSRPWEGVNAIEKSLENFKKITELPDLKRGNEFYESSSVNLGFIRGGDIYNRVPDQCTMGLDIRYIPELDPGRLVRAIEEAVDADVAVMAIEPGVVVSRDQPCLSRLREVIKAVVPQIDPAFSAQHGGSDARFFSAKGIPAVEFGPVGGNWHGDGEYVSLESVENLEAVLKRFALDF